MKQTIKKISITLAVVLALAVLCAAVAFAEPTLSGSFGDNATYSYDADTQTLTFSGTGELSMPNDFEFYEPVKAVVINEGITSLQAGLFDGGSGIESVVLPNSLIQMDSNMFVDCTSLESIVIPPNLNDAVQSFQFAPIKNVTISEGLETISFMMFIGSDIENVLLPNSIREIRSCSFGACPSLESIHLGTNIEKIGYCAFNLPYDEEYNNDCFETIYTCMTDEEWSQVFLNYQFGDIDEDDIVDMFPNERYKPSTTQVITNSHIPDETGLTCSLCGREIPLVGGSCGAQEGGENLTWTFDSENGVLTISGEGAMADYDQEARPWNSIQSGIQSVVIEEGVTTIGAEAFQSSSVETVSLPEGLIEIGARAFNCCVELSSIELPESLKVLGENCLMFCTSLHSIRIPKNVESAFSPFPASGVVSVELEDGLKSIDLAMFSYTGLESLVIPNSVETIRSFAFGACADLEFVRIGTGVRSIGYGAFTDAPGVAMNDELERIETCMSEEEWALVQKNVLDTSDEIEMGLASEYPNAPLKPDHTQIVLNAHVSGEPFQENEVSATCVERAHHEEVTTCTFCGKEASRRTIYYGDVLPHSYGDVNWTWSNDGSVAVAKVVCTLCNVSSITELADLEAVPLDDGTVLCTATVTINGQSATSTKSVAPPSGGATPPGDDTGSGSGGSGSGNGGSSGGTSNKSRCSMCSFYEEYKNKPVVGWIVSIVHFFVHMTSRI